MFRVRGQSGPTYFPGNGQPRILNGVLKRNDFAAGRQNAANTDLRVCVCVCVCARVVMPARAGSGGKKEERENGGPRGKSFAVKIPRIFQDDRLNAVLNEPRLF